MGTVRKTPFRCNAFLRIAIFTVGITLALSISTAACDATLPESSAPHDKAKVVQAINAASSYLSGAVLDNGMFEYRANMNPQVGVPPKYNILRHAGTIYAMVMAYHLRADDTLRAAILSTGNYLRQSAVAPVANRSDMMAVWSRPEINNNRSAPEAKLGGTGLGLVALLAIETIEPGFTPVSELRNLGQFVRFMQKPDGSFYSKYIPSRGGRQDDWESLYYPGEAALGLVMLYEKDPDRPWLDTASKALTCLALERQSGKRVPADHWALIATARLLRGTTESEAAFSRTLMMQHTRQIVDAILKDQCLSPAKPETYGGFANDGRVTPTATRLEGLIAARSYMPRPTEQSAVVDLAVNRGIGFLLRAQIDTGPFKGAFPRAVIQLPREAPQAEKFNPRATEIRIDYVQHALSALIRYLEMQN